MSHRSPINQWARERLARYRAAKGQHTRDVSAEQCWCQPEIGFTHPHCPEHGPAPIPDSLWFDLALTQEDCVWLKSVGVCL